MSAKTGRPIERLACPTVALPSALHKKRDRGYMGWDRGSGAAVEESSSRRADDGSGGNNKKRRYDDKNSEEKAEFMKVMQSVKDLSATSFQGMSKKKYKEEKLIALGAPRVKEQTMPFKMKMGILAGRKKRESREIAVAKESGQVLPKGKGKQREYKRSEDGGLGLDVHTKGGVLHVSRSGLGRNNSGGGKRR